MMIQRELPRLREVRAVGSVCEAEGVCVRLREVKTVRRVRAVKCEGWGGLGRAGEVTAVRSVNLREVKAVRSVGLRKVKAVRSV